MSIIFLIRPRKLGNYFNSYNLPYNNNTWVHYAIQTVKYTLFTRNEKILKIKFRIRIFQYLNKHIRITLIYTNQIRI